MAKISQNRAELAEALAKIVRLQATIRKLREELKAREQDK